MSVCCSASGRSIDAGLVEGQDTGEAEVSIGRGKETKYTLYSHLITKQIFAFLVSILSVCVGPKNEQDILCIFIKKTVSISHQEWTLNGL